MPRGERSAEVRLRTFVAQHRLGLMVTLRTDPAHDPDSAEELQRGIITHVKFGGCGERYTVGWADRTETEHSAVELAIVEDAPEDDDAPGPGTTEETTSP